MKGNADLNEFRGPFSPWTGPQIIGMEASATRLGLDAARRHGSVNDVLVLLSVTHTMHHV
jgi:hypothetical protein